MNSPYLKKACLPTMKYVNDSKEKLLEINNALIMMQNQYSFPVSTLPSHSRGLQFVYVTIFLSVLPSVSKINHSQIFIVYLQIVTSMIISGGTIQGLQDCMSYIFYKNSFLC